MGAEVERRLDKRGVHVVNRAESLFPLEDLQVLVVAPGVAVVVGSASRDRLDRKVLKRATTRTTEVAGRLADSVQRAVRVKTAPERADQRVVARRQHLARNPG